MKAQKEFLGIFLLLFVSCTSFAQYTYPEFPEDSMRWLVRQNRFFVDYVYTFDFELRLTDEDTIVDGKSYNKIFRQASSFSTPIGDPIPPLDSTLTSDIKMEYWGAIREEDKRVYLLHDYNWGILIYDFNLNVGDLIPYPFINLGAHITNIDTVNIGGILRKRFHIIDNGNLEYFIFEGIGTNMGLKPSAPPEDAHLELVCMSNYLTDEVVYLSPNYDECYKMAMFSSTAEVNDAEKVALYPNPAESEVHISLDSEEEISSVKIYDASSRILLRENIQSNQATINISHLNPGFYLVEIACNNGVYVTKLMKK